MDRFIVVSDYVGINRKVQADSELDALKRVFDKRSWDINICFIDNLFEVEKE